MSLNKVSTTEIHWSKTQWLMIPYRSKHKSKPTPTYQPAGDIKVWGGGRKISGWQDLEPKYGIQDLSNLSTVSRHKKTLPNQPTFLLAKKLSTSLSASAITSFRLNSDRVLAKGFQGSGQSMTPLLNHIVTSNNGW